MTTLTHSKSTLTDAIWQTDQPFLRNIMLAIGGSLALWGSAKLQIAFFPVPMTMQTFVVLLIGMAYGPRLGMATVLLYLAEGVVGWPVFAGTPEKGIGVAYMVGPTGGYLLGFVAAAGVVGWLAEKGWDRNVKTTLMAMTLGTAVILTLGVVWLGTVIGWDKPILQLGLIPFIPAAIFKIVLAAGVLPPLWRLVNKRK